MVSLPPSKNTFPGSKDNLRFMPNSFVQASLPYSRQPTNEYRRTAGKYTLILYSPDGLPYGSIPRLILSWLTTESIRTKKRQLFLGNSLSSFLEELGLHRTGGPRGDITRLRQQIDLLFGCFISLRYEDSYVKNGQHMAEKSIRNMLIAESANLIWTPKKVGGKLFQPCDHGAPTITLSEAFYNELLSSPIPVDMNALKFLRNSPMALDMYFWLSYRLKYLRKPTVITWEQLSVQFGANYSRLRDFKDSFLDKLPIVRQFVMPFQSSFDKSCFMLAPMHYEEEPDEFLPK